MIARKTKKAKRKKSDSKKPVPGGLPHVLINFLNNPVSIFDYRTNSVVYVNQAFADLIGFPVNELEAMQESWFSRVHPYDLDVWKKKVLPVISNLSRQYIKSNKQQLAASMCYRFKDSNGKYIKLMTNSSVIEWQGNQRAVVLNIYTDITNHKKDCKLTLEVNIYDHAEQKWSRVHQEEFLNHPEMLAKRETELMRLMTKGYTASEISGKHNINFHTVRAHWRNILRKTNCSSIDKLKELASNEGWI